MTPEQKAALLLEKTSIFIARKLTLSQKSMDYIYRGWTPNTSE